MQNRTIMLHTVDGAILYVGEEVFSWVIREAFASFNETRVKMAVDDAVVPLSVDCIGRIARHFDWELIEG